MCSGCIASPRSLQLLLVFRVVDYLGFNWQILNSLQSLFNGFILNNGLLDFPRDVFDLGLHSIVVSDGPFHGHSLVDCHFLVLHDFTFEWNPFHSFNSVILHILLLEGDVLDSGLYWDLLCNHFLHQVGSRAGAVGGSGRHIARRVDSTPDSISVSVSRRCCVATCVGALNWLRSTGTSVLDSGRCLLHILHRTASSIAVLATGVGWLSILCPPTDHGLRHIFDSTSTMVRRGVPSCGLLVISLPNV